MQRLRPPRRPRLGDPVDGQPEAVLVVPFLSEGSRRRTGPAEPDTVERRSRRLEGRTRRVAWHMEKPPADRVRRSLLASPVSANVRRLLTRHPRAAEVKVRQTGDPARPTSSSHSGAAIRRPSGRATTTSSSPRRMVSRCAEERRAARPGRRGGRDPLGRFRTPPAHDRDEIVRRRSQRGAGAALAGPPLPRLRTLRERRPSRRRRRGGAPVCRLVVRPRAGRRCAGTPGRAGPPGSSSRPQTWRRG